MDQDPGSRTSTEGLRDLFIKTGEGLQADRQAEISFDKLLQSLAGLCHVVEVNQRPDIAARALP